MHYFITTCGLFSLLGLLGLRLQRPWSFL